MSRLDENTLYILAYTQCLPLCVAQYKIKVLQGQQNRVVTQRGIKTVFRRRKSRKVGTTDSQSLFQGHSGKYNDIITVLIPGDEGPYTPTILDR